MKIEELRKSIIRLERWEKLADQAQDAWDAEPLNPDREAAADHYYDLQWHEWLHAAHLIVKIIGTNDKTAREMLNRNNRDRLKNILA